LVIGFIEHLQTVNTSICSPVANSHTLQFTTERSLLCLHQSLPGTGFQRRTFSLLWVPQLPASVFSPLLASDCLPTTKHFISLISTELSLSLSLILRPTVSRPVCLGIKHPSGAYDQVFITCVTVTVLFLWGALSDERSGLSFVCAAGPCQRNLSRVRDHILLSHI
jgi:hypothetical protein